MGWRINIEAMLHWQCKRPTTWQDVGGVGVWVGVHREYDSGGCVEMRIILEAMLHWQCKRPTTWQDVGRWHGRGLARGFKSSSFDCSSSPQVGGCRWGDNQMYVGVTAGTAGVSGGACKVL